MRHRRSQFLWKRHTRGQLSELSAFWSEDFCLPELGQSLDDVSVFSGIEAVEGFQTVRLGPIHLLRVFRHGRYLAEVVWRVLKFRFLGIWLLN